MHIHILGICGTFMGGLALIARELGHKVTGSDANVYPPMSTQLQEQGIRLQTGFCATHLDPAPDLVIIGNALSRGNEAVEYVLNQGLAYTSGPQWLSDHVLQSRWVIAVAGTHGKTTTSSIIAWLLENAGLSPGFLIGGVPQNFGISARLGETPFFVIEADEYDTAFFDKRSKFVHYHPRTLVLNNLEYDHADIFPDIDAIKRQFHHLIRIVPGEGLIIYNNDDQHLQEVLMTGCWTATETFSVDSVSSSQADWGRAGASKQKGAFNLSAPDGRHYLAKTQLQGEHNIANMMAAVAAVRHIGVTPEVALEGLSSFHGVKRRLEVLFEARGATFYDDFAHHPTAILTTLKGLKKYSTGRVIAVLELRSNTMKMGLHNAVLASALSTADFVFLYQPPNSHLALDIISEEIESSAKIYKSVNLIASEIIGTIQAGDDVVIMSNGSFDGLWDVLSDQLEIA